MQALGLKSFLMVALIAVMGLSLHSCFDSDEDPNKMTAMGYYKLTSMMGYTVFVQANSGHQVIPTPASVSTLESNAGMPLSQFDGQVCYISFSWDKTQMTVTDDMDVIDGVKLETVLPLSGKVEVVEAKGDRNDSIDTTPIITISNDDAKPFFFDDHTLMMPILYYVNNSSHSFTLVYYPNEENNTDMPRLYLRHNKLKDSPIGGGSTSATYAGSGYIGLYMFSFNLNQVFGRFETKPTSVTIVTKNNAYSVELENSSTETKETVVTYDPDALKE